jgi:hypothetical protein
VAVIGYFNRVGRNGAIDYWKTLIAPALGALAQLMIIVLLIGNLTFLAGADALVVKLIPLYVAVIAVGGFVYALWLKRSAPQRFAAIGELYDEELMEAFPDE